MYQERFEELKHAGKLPSPSGVAMRLLLLTRDEDCSIEDVVGAIKSDPALTGRIIKLATSVHAGSMVPITTAKDAAVRLGMRSVCNIALGFTLVSGNRAGKCRAFDYDRFWSESLAMAVASEVIAREKKLGLPAEYFTFGLLVGVGRLALASVHPEAYAKVIELAAQGPGADLGALEDEYLFINHRFVAAAMLEQWGLPPFLCEVASYFDGRTVEGEFEHPETAVAMRVLNAADAIARVCTADPALQPHLWAGLLQLGEGLGASTGEVAAMLDLIGPLWADWCTTLSVPTNVVLPVRELEERAADVALALALEEDGGLLRKRSLRVLAVDDDPVSLRVLVSLLKREGHDVLTARDGKEALAVYAQFGAQVVITDWMMPEMDGLTLCRQLRRTEEGRKLYLLILTGRAEEERIVEAFDVGVDDYIVKPFKPELLRARIQPAIRVLQLQEDNDRQVAEKERLNRQLDMEKRKFKAAAMTDALTELPNRRFAMKRLEKEWLNAERQQVAFSVIMMDVDHFKQINDTWGHDVGDVVLKQTARCIQQSLRRGDTCARMGGEEFLVICPSTQTAEGALKVAERIREAIEANHIDCGGYSGSITVSLGVGTTSGAIESIDVLLKVADEAVYEAKNGGRNRVVLGKPPGNERKSA